MKNSATVDQIASIVKNTTPDSIYIKAKIRLKTTEEGGRKNGVYSGYRPNHVFEYRDNQILQTYIGEIQFEGSELLALGEEKIVIVRFLVFPGINTYLRVGNKWWINEGDKLVREAEVIEVLGENNRA